MLPLLAAASLTCESHTTASTSTGPNLILILTDDLDWASVPYLPRLQRLMGDAGATFTNFFVTTSICCTSRATFLRGQYAHNHGVLTNHYPLGGFRRFLELGREQSTIATWLEDVGFRTIQLGKYMNEYPGENFEFSDYVPPGWTEWYALEEFYDLNQRVASKYDGEIVVEPICCKHHETDVLSRRAAEVIRRAAHSGERFFMFLAPSAPHLPAIPPNRHQGAFGGVQAPRTPSFNEEDVSDKPLAIASRQAITPAQATALDELFRQRLRSMLGVEDMLDTVLTALTATELLDETYILVTSDNGFHYGEHRLFRGKVTAYDEDVRVPLFVRGPGIAAGSTVDEITLNNDVAPTLAELAGVVPPADVDGRSFAPFLLRDPAAPGWNRWGFIIQRWRPDRDVPAPAYLRLGYRALRTSDHLYVEWDTGERELYDRRQDPHELNNLYGAVPPGVPDSLAAWLGRLGGCAGMGCAAAEAGG